MENKKIVICGGSGFLGEILHDYFSKKGCPVVIVSRNVPQFDCNFVRWTGATVGSRFRDEIDGAHAVINMAGRSVDCRYSDENKQLIMGSRINSTRTIGQAIIQCDDPPKVWLNSSTATIYKHSFDKEMDEGGEIGATDEANDAFSIEVAKAWENELLASQQTHTTRKIALRTAMVMGANRGGVFHVLRRLARFGLGGKMGSGKQFVSWIHEQDFCRALEFLIEKPDISGAVNISSPNPLPNDEMMKIFRTIAHAPFGLPANRFMLEVGAFFIRTETELILKSRRVVPGKLLKSGFEFSYPKMMEAIQEIESRIQ